MAPLGSSQQNLQAAAQALLPPDASNGSRPRVNHKYWIGFCVFIVVAAVAVNCPLVTMRSHGGSFMAGSANINGRVGVSYNIAVNGGEGIVTGGKKQLLLIIDMQNDYDLSYNMKTYGYKKNPYANQLWSATQHIKSLIDNVDWDMIAFSQDWLIPALASSHGADHQFCLANTPGASPLQELLDAADRKTNNQLRYTKNVDDVFNTLPTNWHLDRCMYSEDPCSVPEDYPNRCYDSNNTYQGKVFADVLKDRGYTPNNTRITIAGTEADMCVLTSTLHALHYGFEIDVYEPGLNGGWNGPSNWCKFNESSPGWEEIAWKCWGAAGREAALAYMEAAGARILWQLPSCSPSPA